MPALTPEQEMLKQAALAATPGPWEQRNKRIPYVWAVGRVKSRDEYLMHQMPIGEEAADYHPDTRRRWNADAAYMASANPAVVLALLAQLEAAQEAVPGSDWCPECHAHESEDLIAQARILELETAQEANNSELIQLREQNMLLLGLYDSAKKLIKAKGRFHTEQNYGAMVAAFDLVASGGTVLICCEKYSTNGAGPVCCGEPIAVPSVPAQPGSVVEILADVGAIKQGCAEGIAQVDAAIGGSAEPVDRECNACSWRGADAECLMCGAVGPLCPECRETTERTEQ